MSAQPDGAPDDGSSDVSEVVARHPRDVAHDAALDAMTELLRQDARAWAAKVRLMVELDDLSVLGAKAGVAQFPHLDMAGSWSVSQLTASRWQWEAERLTTALPRTLAMLAAGDLLEHQGKVLLQRTKHCSVEVAQAVEAEVLPAGAQLFPSDLAKRVDRAVLRIEADQAEAQEAEQRHAAAAAERHTFASPLQDGMGTAGAVLTAEQLVAWQSGLDALERRERVADREAGSERTAEQRRADLFAALPAMVLAGAAQDAAAAGTPTCGCGRGATCCLAVAGGRRPWVFGPEQLAAHVVLDVHVPVSTVLDMSRKPGTLDRYGPVSAEHVRLLRPASFRRIMVDAISGRPIAVDDRTTPVDPDPQVAREQVLAMLRPAVVADVEEPQHDPSARLARLVDLRDRYCCGPGCASTRCERDHLKPYPQGPTSAANLALESPRCHHAKHAGWTLVKHPDGSSTWTSPLGRTYTRPSPHAPPPQVDLWAELPRLRERPVVAPPPAESVVDAEPTRSCHDPGNAETSPSPRDDQADDPPF